MNKEMTGCIELYPVSIVTPGPAHNRDTNDAPPFWSEPLPRRAEYLHLARHVLKRVPEKQQIVSATHLVEILSKDARSASVFDVPSNKRIDALGAITKVAQVPNQMPAAAPYIEN